MISLNDIATPLNGLVGALLRSPLHFVASKGLMVLSWEGRKSGRSFSIPVGVQPHGDGLVVLISKRDEKQWWKNFRTPWPATVHLRGQERDVVGTVVEPGSEAFFGHCERTLRRLPWMASQFGGFRFDPAQGLTAEQRATLVENVGAVSFAFSSAAPSTR